MTSGIVRAAFWSMTAAVCAAGVVDAERKVDAIFAPIAGKLPGAAVAVVVDGRVVLAKGYGLADVEHGTGITPATIFRIASVTKTFTATAVLQLADAGKLSLDDTVAKYLPEMSAGSSIRIRHLLSHTAGITDFLSYEEIQRRPLEFTPGSRLNYSNSGYQVLGRIIEKVSGQPWDEYVREHVLTPAGMKSTGWDLGAALPKRAIGYLFGNDGAYAASTVTDARDAYAAGGLYSTVEDMVRYAQGLASGKLLKRSTLETAWTPTMLSDGRTAPYGFGWIITTYRGVREVGHGGDITGFNSYLAFYPDERLAVVVLSNVGMRPAGPVPTASDLAHRVAELWLGDRLEKPGDTAAVVVPGAILDSYVGRYRIDAPEEVLRNLGRELAARREGGGLVAEANGQKAPLAATSETVFQAPGSPITITFVRGAGGKCQGVVVSLMGLREFRAERIE